MNDIENLIKKNTIITLEIAEMMGRTLASAKETRGIKKGEKHSKGFTEILNDNNIVVVDYFIKSLYVDAKGEKGILFTAKYVKRFRKWKII